MSCPAGKIILDNTKWSVGEVNRWTQLGIHAPDSFSKCYTMTNNTLGHEVKRCEQGKSLYCTAQFPTAFGAAMYCNHDGKVGRSTITNVFYTNALDCWQSNTIIGPGMT
jgi:hypothetical protein